VPPSLETPPLAATLLAAGPRGLPPPYKLYPPLSNTGIQFSSSHMESEPILFFASANPSSRLHLTELPPPSGRCRLRLAEPPPPPGRRRFHRVAVAAPLGGCSPNTAGRRVAAAAPQPSSAAAAALQPPPATTVAAAAPLGRCSRSTAGCCRRCSRASGPPQPLPAAAAASCHRHRTPSSTGSPPGRL
jgi:hypothetical protein